MSFKSDSQRRAAFANMGNRFSCAVDVRSQVPCGEYRESLQMVERKPSGLEILGQAGERLAAGVVGVFPNGVGAGEGDGLVRTNAISGLWPGDKPRENLEDLLVGITTATWPDSSEGRVVDDKHYYVGDHRTRFSYAPLYSAGDLSAMAVDGIGTAGATAVSLVPLVTTLGIGYIGASLALKGKNKLEKEYRKGKAESKKKR